MGHARPEGTIYMATLSTQVTWHGTREESIELVNVVSRNCGCAFGATEVPLSTCSAHRMLIEDQRALDGLLFMRSMRQRLFGEEFSKQRRSGRQL